MSIVLRSLDGQSMMCKKQDIDSMKACAAEFQHVHPSQLVLLHSGRLLIDSCMMESICQQSVIHVVLKPTARIHYRMVQLYNQAKSLRNQLDSLDKLLQVETSEINQAARHVIDLFAVKTKLQEMKCSAFQNAMMFIERLVMFNWHITRQVLHVMTQTNQTNQNHQNHATKPCNQARPTKPCNQPVTMHDCCNLTI